MPKFVLYKHYVGYIAVKLYLFIVFIHLYLHSNSNLLKRRFVMITVCRTLRSIVNVKSKRKEVNVWLLALALLTLVQSCPWVGLTHRLGWVGLEIGREFLFLVEWVGSWVMADLRKTDVVYTCTCNFVLLLQAVIIPLRENLQFGA